MSPDPPRPFAATRPPSSALDELAARIQDARRPGIRYLLGIAGSPGSGKTTLAKALVHRLNQHAGAHAAHLPMDGFHLANSTLHRLGIHDRKGAIDTFDGWGFVALLGRLRAETEHTVFAPSFERSVDEGVAGEIAVEPAAEIVIIEGNYLLADQEPWWWVPDLLDTTWFCATPADEREARLIGRHVRHGRTLEAATAWARMVDGANASLVESSCSRADLIISGVNGRTLDPGEDRAGR